MLQPHQVRVVTEKNELDEKIQKLGQFLEGEMFQALDMDERGRLHQQYRAMKEYSSILGLRIAAF